MQLLYKYYSNESKYALDNLEKGMICFSPLESLNDPLEGVGGYYFDVSDEEQKYWNSIGSDLPNLVSKKISEETWNMFNFKYRVFCSTKEYNNPLLWAYYANSHKGFCVGYEESNILKLTNDVFDIKYCNDMCSINELDDNTYKNLLSVKSGDWSGEKERRAIYELKNSDVSYADTAEYFNMDKRRDGKLYILRGHVQTGDFQILCADRFILKRCEPSVIYLGMRMEWSDKQRLIDIARKFNIRVNQMALKQNSFSFMSQEALN